ncbi:MAG TPA: hypothetical protein VEB63_11085 [Chitinophagaceae bacterium]|nr:hypothetical protein [Chitinophagaceae bacterium]
MMACLKCGVFVAIQLFLLPWAGAQSALGQSDTARELKSFRPPKSREIFHDYVNNEQRSLLRSDGRNDNLFTPSPDEDINYLLTRSLVTRVDWLQYAIEKDTLLNHQGKVRYLRGIEYLLRFFNSNWKSRKVNAVLLPEVIGLYEQCMARDKQGRSFEDLIGKSSYNVGYSVLRADRSTFTANPGYRASYNILVLKYCINNPDETFFTLKENPDVPFADSLVRLVARKYPRQLYDYAAASNKLGAVIRNIQDDVFVRTVVNMARSRSGQFYFPFLDNIVRGKMTIEDIDRVKDDSLRYFRLLVRTQMDYAERALNRDTAYEFAALTRKLEEKARSVFVNEINGLHDLDDPVRFRIIQPLTAEELYYLAVSTDGIIYTSSFTRGVYPLMMKKINNRGDSLLVSLKFDKYRKFIKMAAGYNTLSNFLGSFPNPDDAKNLMRAFVANLEKTSGLEDGVDVADSYASIAETMKPVAREMLTNVQVNYQRNRAQNNRRGMAIYNILNKLFLSADSSQKIDLTLELGIPPVYEVPFRSIANDSGRVIMQVFFYGDKDGQTIFRGFTGMFNSANWNLTGTEKWVQITSRKGRPVMIFANRPLSEEGGEDEKAQKALAEYLEKHKLHPTITIHRGHSYYAPYTINQMFSTSRIVFLGSCGGYHLIHDVLAKAPDAHIIASKQIGKTAVNRPFFQLLTEKVRNGNNIDWIPFWTELDKMITVEGFEDYIPPYKNLGALFIKAYRKAMGED